MTCLAIVEGQTRRKNGLTLFDRTLYRYANPLALLVLCNHRNWGGSNSVTPRDPSSTLWNHGKASQKSHILHLHGSQEKKIHCRRRQ